MGSIYLSFLGWLLWLLWLLWLPDGSDGSQGILPQREAPSFLTAKLWDAHLVTWVLGILPLSLIRRSPPFLTALVSARTITAGLENSDHSPPVRYKKDVWSWESLDEWETLKFTRFEALLLDFNCTPHIDQVTTQLGLVPRQCSLTFRIL
jgi:hypothetical protein